MKKLLLLVLLCFGGIHLAQAQLPDGSIAPDFTVQDVNMGGQSYTLSTYLAQGKTVFIDVFATWCGPCWNYHNSGALENLYEQYGPDGTDEAMVLAIEADGATNIACIFGPSGCVGGTTGDWTAGTPYPICDDPSFNNLYNINYFPTIYMVCPDGRVYESGQLSTSALWAFRQQKCSLGPAAVSLTSVTNVKCFGTNSGAVNISVTGGVPPYTYLWSNNATTQDLNNIPAGDYSCTVTSANNQQTVFGPAAVEGPPAPLTVNLDDSTPAGCNGVLATLTAAGVGGWSNYTYKWNNNQLDATIVGLTPGNYTVTVTDDLACTKSATFNVAPPVMPTASIATPPIITCAQSSAQLNASASSSGSNYVYAWTASAGGTITAGANTTTPTVSSAGLYNLQVTNQNNNCSSYANTSVTANNTLPTANAGPAQTISCTQSSTQLSGTGSTGNNFTYLWTAAGGGNISSGANTLTPTVTAAGTYTLKVTNTSNGCFQTSATGVTGIAPPVVNTTSGAITCLATSVNLATTTNAGNPGFSWTGPNNFSSTVQSPTVNTAGSYTLVVLDSITGCSKTTTATVATNNTPPGATAAGGVLNCVVNTVVLNGASPDTSAVYAWTGPNAFTSTAPNPSVTVDGVYNLAVTNTSSGCVSTAVATVALNNTAPSASAVTPGSLNCNATQLQLNGTGSSQGSNFTYAWTTTTGNILSGANTTTPTVDQAGTYNLQVNNTDNGCTAVAATSVVLNTAVSAPAAVQANVACNGGSNGMASVAASGGNGTYNYVWSNGATTASIANLAAGVYNVVVTDGENCTATASVEIQQPAALNANVTSTSQSAVGVNDGTATAAPSGGTATYTYLWNNNETTASIVGLAPGAYTVVVTDANGCTQLQTVNVNAYNCALQSSVVSNNISCFGANNGSAEVVLVGANMPVVYSWSNGANGATATNLAAGNYTVNVLDANNCPAELNVSISEPAVLQANATTTPETSSGANNGTATATPVGGTSTYTYLWNNNETTQSITGLAPGTYTVIVTDANGCTSQETVNVSAFACALSTSATTVNVNCAGAANGSVSVALTGGTAPFTYTWSNGGGNSATISNLSGGTYTVLIVDDNGCETTTTAAVSEPAPFTTLAVTTVAPACPNDATGSAAASLGGGVEPYAYAWSNGATGQLASNLVANTYTVVVTDANNCQTSTSVAIVATDSEAPTVVAAPNATIFLDINGIATPTTTALSVVAADNCTVASTTMSPSSFTCDQLGDHTVTITVTDAVGLTTTTTSIVKVVDNIAPSLTCPNSISACSYDNIVTYAAPVAVDNCLLSGGEWKLEGLPSGSVFPIGVSTQTYTYKDASGNQGACSFEVVITPPVDFQDVLVTNDINNQGVGAININLSGGVAPLTFEWTRNEVVVGTTQNLNGITSGLYILEVTDANDCVYSSTSVTVGNTSGIKEPDWLNGVRLQPNPTSGITQVVFARVPSSTLEISVVDGTGRVLLTDISDNQALITLDCTRLPGGMYTIRFSTGAETGVRKLVINR